MPCGNFFPYKSSYHFRYLNCCQILYLNATDLKLGSSTYFFLLFLFLVLTKCQFLNLRVGTGRSCDQVLQRASWYNSLVQTAPLTFSLTFFSYKKGQAPGYNVINLKLLMKRKKKFVDSLRKVLNEKMPLDNSNFDG